LLPYTTLFRSRRSSTRRRRARTDLASFSLRRRPSSSRADSRCWWDHGSSNGWRLDNCSSWRASRSSASERGWWSRDSTVGVIDWLLTAPDHGRIDGGDGRRRRQLSVVVATGAEVTMETPPGRSGALPGERSDSPQQEKRGNTKIPVHAGTRSRDCAYRESDERSGVGPPVPAPEPSTCPMR